MLNFKRSEVNVFSSRCKSCVVGILFDTFFDFPSSFLKPNKKQHKECKKLPPGKIVDLFILDIGDFRIFVYKTRNIWTIFIHYDKLSASVRTVFRIKISRQNLRLNRLT